MMIKLFLITLLCATLVFADSPVQDFEDAWKQPVNGFLSMADQFMGRGNSLVRRSAQGPPPTGPPRGGGGGGASGGFDIGAGAGGGFDIGAGAGGGAGAGRK